ncbi:hypothetical protein ACLOJK_000601 [Asimina triloba]
MGNCLRCCVSCILPCGSLDVVRVLHVDGRIDEYSRRITAGEVMQANPKHVLAQPIGDAIVKKPALLHPDAELHKGKIYFLVPNYTLHKDSSSKPKSSKSSKSKPLLQTRSSSSSQTTTGSSAPPTKRDQNMARRNIERAPLRHPTRRRTDGAAAWKPILESISESDDTQSDSP